MSHTAAPDGHQAHHDHVHLPPPSYWPIFTASATGLLATGVLLWLWHASMGVTLIVIGSLLAITGLMGWCQALIKENDEIPDIMEDDRWMKMGLKLFLVSEAAIFGAFFAHHYYTRFDFPKWPPVGAPELDTTLPAIATLILMTSSVTMEYSHHLLKHGNRDKSRLWLGITLLLGIIFMGFQGHEYGFLKAYDKFTLESGMFGSHFFAMTGFHGAHVATGIVMMFIVGLRLRLGHYTPERHFSFAAASWYWHFVDVIWIFLFFTIYLF
ncbi:MAG: cytochrome c oxidase subunit 3 [bacterium]|nr:cytochrome c oxidase subunit 3 [bacterium]